MVNYIYISNTNFPLPWVYDHEPLTLDYTLNHEPLIWDYTLNLVYTF